MLNIYGKNAPQTPPDIPRPEILSVLCSTVTPHTHLVAAVEADGVAAQPDEVHEGYHLGGPRELIWKDDLAQGGVEYGIAAGQALFVPVMAPHFVRNGPESSISLSITWRSDWSYAEADARGFNRELRRLGLNPRAPGRWPASNRSKAFAFRAIRKLGIIR